MKYLAFAVLIIFIYACNENVKTNNNSIDQTSEAIKSITDDSIIVGYWSMCAESGGGQMIQYNVCPTVIFNSDGSGSKISAGGFPESFSWTLNDKALKIYYSSLNRNKTFPDTNYMAILRRDTSGLKLEIRQLNKDYTLYLGRGG